MCGACKHCHTIIFEIHKCIKEAYTNNVLRQRIYIIYFLLICLLLDANYLFLIVYILFQGLKPTIRTNHSTKPLEKDSNQ